MVLLGTIIIIIFKRRCNDFSDEWWVMSGEWWVVSILVFRAIIRRNTKFGGTFKFKLDLAELNSQEYLTSFMANFSSLYKNIYTREAASIF